MVIKKKKTLNFPKNYRTQDITYVLANLKNIQNENFSTFLFSKKKN